MKKINYILAVILLIVIILFIMNYNSIKDGLTPPAPTIGWLEDPNFDYPGNDIRGGNGTKEQAQEACASNAQCLGYNHNKTSGAYWLKKKLDARGPLPGFTFYTKQTNPPTTLAPTTPSTVWIEDPNHDYPGNDIRGGNGTKEQAQDACASNAQCLGYNHNKTSGAYWLKKKLGARGPLPGFTFYTKQTNPPTTVPPTTPVPSIPLYKYFLDSPYGLMCLDGADNNISMRPCNNNTEQQWYKGDYDNEYTTLMNNKTHNCLDIVKNGQQNKIKMNGCNNSPGQIWRSPPTNKQFKVFRSRLTDPSNKCLDGSDGSLLMKPCNSSGNQNWNTQLA